MQNDPQFQKDNDALQRIIMAGQLIMYDEKTRHIFMQGLRKKGPIADILATEAAGLIKMIDDKSKGTLPTELIASAALMFLVEMARFAKGAGVADPSESDLKQAIAKLMAIIMRVYHPGQQAQAPAAPAAPVQPQPAAQPAGMIAGA